MSAFYHVVEADPDAPPGTMARLCLVGPCADLDHCEVAIEQHVMVLNRGITRPLLYAEIRRRGLMWRVRVMRRNEMGDAYPRSEWSTAWTRSGAETLAGRAIQRLSAPQAPPLIYVPEAQP